MVYDHIKYASAYFNLSPGIRLALEYLRSTNAALLAEGRHVVDGERVFALVSDYTTKRADETFWEAHRRHVDVQYVHTGRERIAVGDIADFRCEPYNVERDLVVAHGDSTRSLEMCGGNFAILFPHDVHMPGLVLGASEQVRKIVVKVRLAD